MAGRYLARRCQSRPAIAIFSHVQPASSRYSNIQPDNAKLEVVYMDMPNSRLDRFRNLIQEILNLARLLPDSVQRAGVCARVRPTRVAKRILVV